MAPQTEKPKVLILGSGPNRIGQGIEFDYSCVHAVMALRGVDYETVMVNCNPETVSTDYDTADRLYFEPLTFEDVLEVWHAEDSSGKAAGGPGVVGVIVQLGGQTPLGLANRLKAAGVPIVGTSPESIDLAEDRGLFGAVLAKAGLRAPAHGTATSYDDAKAIADEIGYPVLVRPSYVLGGRGMEIVYDDATLRAYLDRATAASPDHDRLDSRAGQAAVPACQQRPHGNRVDGHAEPRIDQRQPVRPRRDAGAGHRHVGQLGLAEPGPHVSRHVSTRGHPGRRTGSSPCRPSGPGRRGTPARPRRSGRSW